MVLPLPGTTLKKWRAAPAVSVETGPEAQVPEGREAAEQASVAP